MIQVGDVSLRYLDDLYAGQFLHRLPIYGLT